VTIGFIFYAIAALFLSWAILALVRAWQRPRYAMEDFWAASERIFLAVAGLTWLLEGTKLALPEDFALPAWVCEKRALDGKTLRRECRAILRDILANTAVIMDQAEHCGGGLSPDDPTALQCLRAISKGGWMLLLRVRWTDLLLALTPYYGIRSTLQSGQRYALLWLALLEILRHLYPELREEVAV
jgi:hypothetical protein